MRKAFDQLLGARLRQMRLRPRWFGFADDAVDAAEVGVLFEPSVENLLAQIARDVKTVFQNAVVQIDDVKAAVRSVVEVHGTKPFVGRGEELRVVISILRFETHASVFEHVTLDQIPGGFAEEHVAFELARKIIPAIHQRRARGGECGQGAVGPQLARAIAAIDAGIHADRPDCFVVVKLHVDARGAAIMRIAPQIS